MSMENAEKTKKTKAEYMREYRRKHPEYTRADWIKTALRVLTREGYTIIKPANAVDSGR